MAYLERDVDTPLVYVGGSLRNPRIPEIGNLLRANGYDAMDEWFTPGEKADDNWQAYEALRGRTYREALLGRAATNIFLFDRSYLDLSDAFVAVAPYGKSAAIEMGYAAGGGIPTLLYTDGEDMGRYEIMPNTVDAVVHTEEELLYHLKKLLAPIWGTE